MLYTGWPKIIPNYVFTLHNTLDVVLQKKKKKKISQECLLLSTNEGTCFV